MGDRGLTGIRLAEHRKTLDNSGNPAAKDPVQAPAIRSENTLDRSVGES
jgi:hypothetical protein